MKSLFQIVNEIVANFAVNRRLARFNVRSRWADNYLGSIWDYLEPTIYIITYFIVFGLGMYNGTVNGQPYILWLLVGIVPWYFIQGSYNKGMTSISSQLNLLTKMKFPISIAPIMPMLEEMRRFLFLTAGMVIVFLLFGELPNIHWLQWGYAVLAMLTTVFAHNLINSTMTVILPDYKPAAAALFRLLFFTSGVIINIDAKGLPFILIATIKLFPFYYVLEQFRDAFLNNVWFWEQATNAAFFWTLSIGMALFGSVLQIRFRDRFIDMM